MDYLEDVRLLRVGILIGDYPLVSIIWKGA